MSAITAIASGHPAATTHWTADNDEMRKRITSLAREGDRVAAGQLDRPLGGAALDMALMMTRWKDRILGKSEQVELPVYTVWFATGNNVTLAGEMRRRVLWVRSRTAHANPEDRAGFRHPKLLQWVDANRPRLLAAALTLLSGYLKAGCPAPAAGLPSWGSYEGWSAVVRGAVVWVGLPDPRDPDRPRRPGRPHGVPAAGPAPAAGGLPVARAAWTRM